MGGILPWVDAIDPHPGRASTVPGLLMIWPAPCAEIWRRVQLVDGRGLLVAIEGIDGSGKTHHARRLRDALTSRGHAVTLSHEPWTTPEGDRVRHGEGSLADTIIDRDRHLLELVLPSLARGEIVLLDRYYASTVVYQGARWRDCAERWPRPLWIHMVTSQLVSRERVMARGETPPSLATARRYDALPWSPVGVFGDESEMIGIARSVTAIEQML